MLKLKNKTLVFCATLFLTLFIVFTPFQVANADYVGNAGYINFVAGDTTQVLTTSDTLTGYMLLDIPIHSLNSTYLQQYYTIDGFSYSYEYDGEYYTTFYFNPLLVGNFDVGVTFFETRFKNRVVPLNYLLTEQIAEVNVAQNSRINVDLVFTVLDRYGVERSLSRSMQLGQNDNLSVTVGDLFVTSDLQYIQHLVVDNEYFVLFTDCVLSVTTGNYYSEDETFINFYGVNYEDTAYGIYDIDTYFDLQSLFNFSTFQVDLTRLWIEPVNGFLSFELFPNFSLANLLTLCIAIPLLLWILKLFAGG